jgi:hypothetical protein
MFQDWANNHAYITEWAPAYYVKELCEKLLSLSLYFSDAVL